MTPDPPAADGLRVLPAARSDGATAAEILAAAFSRDEHTVGLLPSGDRRRRLHALFTLMVDEAFAAGGHVWLATEIPACDGPATDGPSSDGPRVLGVALWEAPGHAPPVHHTVWHLPAYAAVFGRRLRDALRTDRAAAAHRPRVPHWYLKDLGTAPEARGRGVGAALLRHRITAADATGTGIYLESSSAANVGYYRRFGFVERSVVPASGTVDLVGMWRPPAAPTG